MNNRLRKARLVLATLTFVGLTALFLDFTGTMHHIVGWMAKMQALEAVLALNVVVVAVLAVATLTFGRIYCSVVCPLGILQDIFGWLGKRQRKNRYSYSKAKNVLRYGVLAVFAAALLAGGGVVVQVLAPYSAFGRIVTALGQPIWEMGAGVLARMAESHDSYAFYAVDVWMRSLPVLLLAVVTLGVLAVLAWVGGRTYCNTICPVGTALSLLSRFSWMKIRFLEGKCKSCSLCTKNCKAACIDFKTQTVDHSRCVVCGDCLDKCKFGALEYAHRPTASSQQPDPSRRAFLLASALATTAAMAQEKKVFDGGYATLTKKVAPERQTPLSPPGSVGAHHFTQHCTGCQLCVSKCPNNVLRPSTKLTSFMLPTMSYERGHCRPECTICSEVCPAGAIRPIDVEEKSSTQIGHAVWIKKNCVSVTDGVECGNCARHCPAGAIEMVALDANDDLSPMVPAVNESACIGCGACEYVCPSRPFPAIYVEGHEVHRHI